MAVSTDVNDPSFGLETDQSSPNFGLASEPPKQESVVGNALAGAGDVIKGFAQQFVPKFDLKTLAGLAYGPVNAQIQGYNAIKSIGDTAAQVQAADETPAFSRERFGAGLNVVGQLGLLALGGREKPLSEIALGKTPEVAPEAMPQTPEPLAAEAVAQQPIITEAPVAQPEAVASVTAEPIQQPSAVSGIEEPVAPTTAARTGEAQTGKPFSTTAYHGTRAADQLDPEFLGLGTGAKSAKQAFFFSSNKELAQDYADTAFPKEGLDARRSLINSEAEQQKLKETFDVNLPEDQQNAMHARYAELDKVIDDAKETITKHSLERGRRMELGGLSGDADARVLEHPVQLQNPYVVDFHGRDFREKTYSDILEQAKKAGHDGVIFKNTYDPASVYRPDRPTDIYAVFPETLKAQSVPESHVSTTASSQPKTEEAQPPTTAAIKPEEVGATPETPPAVAETVPAGTDEGFTPEGDYPVSGNSVAKAKAEYPDKPNGWTQERYDIFIRQRAGAIEDQVRRNAPPAPKAEGATTAESLPKEAPTEAVEPPTVVSTPESVAKAEPVGIAERYREDELGAGSVIPGVGKTSAEARDWGHDFINKGGNPYDLVNKKGPKKELWQEVGGVRAEYERLGIEKRKAEAAYEANPDDPLAQMAFDNADEAQRKWSKDMQPVLTRAGDALRAASRAYPREINSFSDFTDILHDHYGGEVELTPVKRAEIQKLVKATKQVNGEANGAREQVTNESVKRAGGKVLPFEDLKSDLRSTMEQLLKDCAV